MKEKQIPADDDGEAERTDSTVIDSPSLQEVTIQTALSKALNGRDYARACLLLQERGEQLLQWKNWDAAAIDFQESLELARRANLAELQAEALYGIGRTSAGQGDIENAKDVGQRSYTLFRGLDAARARVVQAWLKRLG